MKIKNGKAKGIILEVAPHSNHIFLVKWDRPVRIDGANHRKTWEPEGMLERLL